MFFMPLLFFFKKMEIMFLFFIFFINYNNFYYLFFDLDILSNNLIFLSTIIIFFCVIASKKSKILSFVNIIMLLFLILFFSSNNLFIFYFLFEGSLIPILVLILGWGYQIERIQASFYLFFYMILFSFPFFFFFMMFLFMKFNFFIFYFSLIKVSKWSLFFIIGVFLVKSPLYFFHFWLPKAHVEASVIGSMILAGILLKMGSFGVYRFLWFFTFQNFEKIFSVLILAVILSLIFCAFQSDLKSMIAYSSVNHMSLLILSVVSLSIFSFKGSIFMMIIHGILSPLMFFVMNLFYYHSFSRLFYFTQFMLFFSKNFSMLLFWLFVFNLNFPIFMSFFSEIFLIFSLFFFNKVFIFFLIFISIFSCYYSIFMLSNMIYGKMKFFFNQLSLQIINMLLLLFFLFLSMLFIIILFMF